MSTAGPSLPASGVNTDNAGSAIAWQNPGNIVSDNGQRATATANGTAASDFLDATQFGFSIPLTDTIDGITVVFQRFQSAGTTGSVNDSSVRLILAGVAVGDDKATAIAWDSGGERNDSYGGVADTWNASLTAANVNTSTFGARLALRGAAAGADRVGRVDIVTITITHSTPAASGGTRHQRRTAATRRCRR